MTNLAIAKRIIGPVQNYLGRYLDRTARVYAAEARRYAAGREFSADDLSWSPLKTTSARAVKRAIDIAGGLIGAAALVPTTIILAPVIRFFSPGPLLFFHVREGLNECPFKLPKFRTMNENMQVGGHDGPDKTQPLEWAQITGRRVTGAGRYMRALAIDELPQCVLLLNGKLTMMGPRALSKVDLDRHEDPRYNWREVRKKFTPALGPAAFCLSGAFSSREEIELMEIYYFGNWTLWLDIKLLGRGLLAIAAGRHY
ncbi:hypothetical protein A2625_06770 [candidate division WOR-1 bacterium RIFCSPHIGHO2_01_FULL_53_15]|uniref:Bacterial sugar transferase domain-containing protein n=1 Tax=candidate division WOR-1 bacterium RIFCSPHIGHO2_01_FULL_53_15 TaxID=1802564 RepID=A0A1F4Q548_UNCSA|nr:MAG: hypothetical protein A2625_06770 [candidate division WOR-1 bacterium RIFCSPHIGHO2_01_FULL_53_15]OGC10307.1 MAG: hypothetical protein A3D23_06775 [candidate division WOR-1 bacterium RIFCSPHIGHO2_02_FULL_53_26]